MAVRGDFGKWQDHSRPAGWPVCRAARDLLPQISCSLFVSLLLIIISISRAPMAAACVGGGTSTLPTPATTFLRSYWAGLSAPTRIATDAAGNIYVADATAGQVVVRSRTGTSARVKQRLVSPSASPFVSYAGDGSCGSVSGDASDWNRRLTFREANGEFITPNDVARPPLETRR